MCRPRVTMIALFLGILFLCHSHGTFSKNSTGDYPDANEVMKKLPQTFLLQSAFNLEQLECRYHQFYNHTKGNQTYRKYYFKFIYKGRKTERTFYVKNVTGYNISMAKQPEAPVTYSRQILFSNMRSCMIIRNPDPRKYKDCYLMVTKEHFSRPQERCLAKFQEHCKGPAFNYTMAGCDKPENHN